MADSAPDRPLRDRWRRTEDGISLVRPPRPAQAVHFAAQPQALTLDLARTALIVIDMQNDFLDADGWFATTRGADVAPLAAVLPRINALSAACRSVGVPVVHLNWGVRADTANLPANVLDKGSDCGARPGYGDPIASGEVLVQGSWGAESVPAILTAPGDIHVAKHRLSGFRDNELDQILRRLDVTTLLYTGVNLDRCVFATLADGCFQGFDAVLIEDATTTVSPDFVSEAITYLIRLLYGFTATTADLLAALPSDTSNGDSE